MKNFDAIKTSLDTAKANLMSVMAKGNEEDQKKAFEQVIDAIAEDVQAQANAELKQMIDSNRDDEILMNRSNRRILTSKERKYFNQVIEKGNLASVAEAFPVTIVEDVLAKIETEHPILSRVDSRTVSGIMKYIYAKPNAQLAFWGDICEDIKQLILKGFAIVDLQAFKLSGFLVMCKGMLELGPEWLAEFIYRTLYEIMSTSLEYTMVAGEGPAKKQPIGMIKSLVGVVDGVYKDKTALTLTGDLTPFSFAGVRAALAKAKMGAGQISILVNPETYWGKLFKAFAIQTADGRWVLNNLPTGEEVLESYAVPVDKVIVGNLMNYFLGIASDIKIEEYKETLAIEDLDLYIAKFFGNGTPKDLNAFFVVDVSQITTTINIPELETEVVAEQPVEDPIGA